MAVLDTFRPTAAASNRSFAGIFGSLFAAVTAWNDARITRKSLSQLSARELDDIGLTRADIDSVARRVSY